MQFKRVSCLEQRVAYLESGGGILYSNVIFKEERIFLLQRVRDDDGVPCCYCDGILQKGGVILENAVADY